MEVADRVAVLNSGHIEQIGTPEQVYHTPASSFVYDFLGNYNVLDGWKDDQGELHFSEPGDTSHPTVKLFARPHEMIISRRSDHHQSIRAIVVHINPAGPLVKLELERTNGSILQAEISKDAVESLQLKKSDQVFVRPKVTRLFE